MTTSAIKPSIQAAFAKRWAEASRRWSRLSPREQRLLTWAAAVVGLALVYLVLVEPAWTTYRKLEAALPTLRTQAATVDALTNEARNLQRSSGGKMSAAETRQALVDTLHQAGLEAKVDDGVAADSTPIPDALQVTVDQVSASALMQWLESVPAQTRLKLKEVALERPVDDNGRLMTGKASGVLLFVPSSSNQPH
jgi:general secretion pathway protein M